MKEGIPSSNESHLRNEDGWALVDDFRQRLNRPVDRQPPTLAELSDLITESIETATPAIFALAEKSKEERSRLFERGAEWERRREEQGMSLVSVSSTLGISPLELFHIEGGLTPPELDYDDIAMRLDHTLSSK